MTCPGSSRSRQPSPKRFEWARPILGMAARRTDTEEQAAQIFALRRQTDRLFFHEVVAAFTGSGMCLGSSHWNLNDMPIFLPSDWDNPETAEKMSPRQDGLIRGPFYVHSYDDIVVQQLRALIPWARASGIVTYKGHPCARESAEWRLPAS